MGFSPRYIQHGINDLSIKAPVIEQTEYGQHLTKWFVKTAKGTYNREIMSGPEVVAKYGSDSFSVGGGFRNHQTVFLEGAMSTSKVVIQRINMGGSSATLTHYIDIATKTSTIKKRTPAGELDGTADDLAADVEGLVLKHIVMNDGRPTIQEGTMTNTDGTASTMYPILNFSTEDGSYYNNLGYTLKALESSKREVVLNKQFLYNFTFRETIEGYQGIRKTISGAPSAKLGLLETISPLTKTSIEFKKVVEHEYSNTTNRNRGWVYPDFDIEINHGNIALILKRIEASEKAFIIDETVSHEDTEGGAVDYADWFDVSEESFTDDTFKLFNLVSLMSTSNVPYMTVALDETPIVDAGKILVNSDTVLQFAGGTDVSETLLGDAQAQEDYYNAQVRGHLREYNDSDSDLMETALNPESVIYDSGWDIETKKTMVNFIGIRKDTGIHMSTYITDIDGTRTMTVEEEVAISKLIKGRLLLAPESTYFNTEVARASISFGSCNISGSSYKGRVPTTYDLMMKLNGFMGAGSRKWVLNKQFDSGDESATINIEDILPKTLPLSIKNEIWNTGVNWTEPLYNDKTYHWTSFSTVSKDTSALNNVMVMHAAMWSQRVQIFGWKKFTGENRLSRPAFIERTEQYLRDQLRGAFDGRFNVTPTTVFTENDLRHGNYWSTDVKFGVNDSYTVVNTSTTIERKL